MSYEQLRANADEVLDKLLDKFMRPVPKSSRVAESLSITLNALPSSDRDDVPCVVQGPTEILPLAVLLVFLQLTGPNLISAVWALWGTKSKVGFVGRYK